MAQRLILQVERLNETKKKVKKEYNTIQIIEKKKLKNFIKIQ